MKKLTLLAFVLFAVFILLDAVTGSALNLGISAVQALLSTAIVAVFGKKKN